MLQKWPRGVKSDSKWLSKVVKVFKIIPISKKNIPNNCSRVVVTVGVAKRRAVTVTFDTYRAWGARQHNYVRLNRVAIERAGADFILLIPHDAARSAAGENVRTAKMVTWYRETWPETLKELQKAIETKGV